MKMRGVKYFHVYCIDNILCKVADPHWPIFVLSKPCRCSNEEADSLKGNLTCFINEEICKIL
ncbi:hypothetical protein COOONC_13005 [Cooperia oncophora]